MIINGSDNATFWQQHLNQFRTSGQSRTVYCRQHGLKVHQLAYQLDKRGKAKSTPTAAFARVVAQAPSPAAQDQTGLIRLVLADGMALEVDRASDPRWVAQLVTAMGGRG